MVLCCVVFVSFVMLVFQSMLGNTHPTHPRGCLALGVSLSLALWFGSLLFLSVARVVPLVPLLPAMADEVGAALLLPSLSSARNRDGLTRVRQVDVSGFANFDRFDDFERGDGALMCVCVCVCGCGLLCSRCCTVWFLLSGARKGRKGRRLFVCSVGAVLIPPWPTKAGAYPALVQWPFKVASLLRKSDFAVILLRTHGKVLPPGRACHGVQRETSKTVALECVSVVCVSSCGGVVPGLCAYCCEATGLREDAHGGGPFPPLQALWRTFPLPSPAMCKSFCFTFKRPSTVG